MVVCYTAYVVLLELHSWTYVWQSTVLADYMYSDLRSTCDLNVQKTAPRDTSPVTTIHESASNQQQLQQPLKIGIIVLYGKGAVGEWGEDVMKQVLDNRYAYAKLHGYDVINANSVIDSSRPVAWSKLLAVKEYLPKYDYIMYIDMDAVIMEPSITAESLITAANAGSEKSPDIIMQTDWNGPNTGIWFAKNTKWTNDFLQLVWNQKQLVGKTSSNGVSHPFEYEQRAFHYLLDTDIWKSRDLPTYDREKSIEFSTHFVFLPQCAMNSYTLHPLDIKHINDRKKSQVVVSNVIDTRSSFMLNMCTCSMSMATLSFILRARKEHQK